MTYSLNTLNASSAAKSPPRTGAARFGHEIGLVVGLLALAFPELMTGGYGWVQWGAIGMPPESNLAGAAGFTQPQLGVRALFLLALLKTVATGFTISSGGSGGVLRSAASSSTDSPRAAVPDFGAGRGRLVEAGFGIVISLRMSAGSAAKLDQADEVSCARAPSPR